MSLWGKVKKAVKDITGTSDKEKDARRKAEKQAAEAVAMTSAGQNEQLRQKMAAMRQPRSRRRTVSRGRDSTIITQGSEIQSRTLLG